MSDPTPSENTDTTADNTADDTVDNTAHGVSDRTGVIVREFFGWVDETDRHDAVGLLEDLAVPNVEVLAMVLARAMHSDPGISMSPLDVVELVVLLLNGGAIDHHLDPTNVDAVNAAGHLAINNRIRGIFETRQQAAFAAVRQLGTAREFGVSDAIEAELGNTHHSATATTLDLVERVAADRHGWLLRHSDRLGWVLFRTTDD